MSSKDWMAPRQYHYVGSHNLLYLLHQESQRWHVQTVDDVVRWYSAAQPPPQPDGSVTATFIIDLTEQFWIADQRSEHVVCAAGHPVLSAGEISFAIHAQDTSSVTVTAITNQSTGYCPEPDSWTVVAAVLHRINLPTPPGLTEFTTAYQFRRCTACGTTNLIKDAWLECAVCQSPLDPHWNFDSMA